MSVKRSKPVKPSKPAKSVKPPNKPKLSNKPLSDKPLTPLLTVDACPTIPKNRGNNGDSSNKLKRFVNPVQSTNPTDPPIPWNLEHALVLRVKHNFTREQIAEHFGIAYSTCRDRMVRFKSLLTGDELESFRTSRSDLLDSVEARLLSQMTDADKLKAASLNNLAFSLRQTAELGRLERNQSTANIEIHVEPGMQDHIDSVATSYSDKLLADAAQCGPDTGDTD